MIRIGSIVDKLIVRSDAIADSARHVFRQVILLCFQKLHEQLTVGC